MVSASAQQSKIIAKFVIGDKARFALTGGMNNQNVRKYASANQPPDSHYNVNDSRQKLTVWVGLCGNSNSFRGYTFDDSVISKSVP